MGWDFHFQRGKIVLDICPIDIVIFYLMSNTIKSLTPSNVINTLKFKLGSTRVCHLQMIENIANNEEPDQAAPLDAASLGAL